MSKTNNLHIVLNPFINDTRILKETKSISKLKLFQNVYIAALHQKGLKQKEKLDKYRTINRFHLISRKLPKTIHFQVIKYLELLIKIFLRFKKKNIKIVHCHNTSALPIGLIFKIFNNSKLIYDTHELAIGQFNLRGIKKILTILFEKILITQTESIITVNQSIKEWYKQKYSLRNNIYVVRNIPYTKYMGEEKDYFRNEFNIKNTDIIFGYIGGFKINKKLDILLEIFKNTFKQRHIVFMGHGNLEMKIIKYTEKYPNIHFFPAVKSDNVLEYTSGLDVGINFSDMTKLNGKYSLPNKFFQYLFSGVPIITNYLPEQTQIIDKYNCGWKVKTDFNKIKTLITSITKEDIVLKAAGARKARRDFSWQNEEQVLKKIYHSLLNPGFQI